ncbi:uncharacterized protein At5g08430-like [Silene latifolia]|uniref:uncharacterized protein At5g08430-like n=1 Tax=Silene latifolia TaxID=37657 RepID=UPI003D76DB86
MEKKKRNCVMQQEKQVKKQQHEVNKVVEEDDEKVSEDYCFVCKDGGTLIVCDHKDCVKAFHPDCVGLDESTEETDVLWICDWHSCLECKRSSKYQCYCCTNAVCQSCFKKVSFARVRGSKGLCNDCLHLALLGDEGMDVDSDGETVDFKDRETYEGLFKEYWDIIKEKEGLTLLDLHDADVQIKKGEKARVKPLKPQYESDKSVELEENREPMLDDHNSDDHDSERAGKPVIGTNNKRPKKTPKRKRGSSRIEYIGWASKSLIEFLAAIGVDTNEKLFQSDVSSLIHKYAKENKLFHPEKRKIILCDARLRPLLKRRTISIYKINDAIEAHFLENLEQSEDDGYSSGYEEKYATLPTKKQAWWKNMESSLQHKGQLMEKFLGKEVIPEEPKKIETVTKIVYSDFATVVPQNMQLVYLKRGLVESLLENCETFESKVMGSFVKVKSEPVDPKYPYQLLPVTGIKKEFGNEKKIVLLQVSNLPNDISMRMLSNEDVSLEDCECLLQKIETGLIPKLTVVEVEKKAKDLHEDITKYAIARELSLLKYRIDQANEKGRRAELYEFRRRRELLQSEEEQTRMLNELPRVIAEVIEVKPDSEDPESNNIDVGTCPSINPSKASQDCKNIPA